MKLTGKKSSGANKAVSKRKHVGAGLKGQITIKLNKIMREVAAIRKIVNKLKH